MGQKAEYPQRKVSIVENGEMPQNIHSEPTQAQKKGEAVS